MTAGEFRSEVGACCQAAERSLSTLATLTWFHIQGSSDSLYFRTQTRSARRGSGAEWEYQRQYGHQSGWIERDKLPGDSKRSAVVDYA